MICTDFSNTFLPPFIRKVSKEGCILATQPSFHICLLKTGSGLQVLLGGETLYLVQVKWF